MRKEFITMICSLILSFPSLAASVEISTATQEHGVQQETKEPILNNLSLQDCIEIALKNNHTRPASQFAVEIADAQLGQALSSYWPEIGLRSTYTHMNHEPNFVFPASTMSIPSTTIVASTPMGPLPVNVPAQSFNVPEQNVKLMNRNTLSTSLNVMYPLFTGGQRPAIVKQARSGLEAAKQEARRTDMQVIYDVKRMYYGAVLASELYGIGNDALQRMEVTLELTEKLYKIGSGRVKKTDYLRNKSIVEELRSGVAALKANKDLALAALTNTMGLEWSRSISISEAKIPFNRYQADLSQLVSNAYMFNPDWARMQEGLKAAEAHIDEAQSGHMPKVALIGSLVNMQNAYDKGIATSNNKNNWNVGAALELPIFSGFRTKEEVREATARLGKLSEEKVQLREGIALQVKHIFTMMISAQDQQQSSNEAAKAAEENRDLNERAYQDELVETKDVIEAQLIESFMKAQYQKTLYDHIETQAHLDYIVGKEVHELMYGR
ncbi:MAG TPA: TolC family protein [Dissulfurispiraceae bacterium]|nr:TolC family protein [Dissulfurispiraceae bacterium]